MRLHAWIHHNLVRHYPATPPQEVAPFVIDVARNERCSLQVGVRMEGDERQTVRLEASGPAGWEVRVRRVGYVPMPHHNTPVLGPADTEGLGRVPGYVPDPLFDEDALLLPVGETHAFWVTVQPGVEATPGTYSIALRVVPEQGEAIALEQQVIVHDVTLQPRSGFNITHWFYVDALMDWYQTEHFDARFWHVLEAYVRDMVAHGQDTLLVPAFTPPTDGVKRPSQLVRVTRTGQDAYTYDWSDVERYIALAQRCGITHYEWSHLFTQWGAANAIRIYEDQGQDERLLWAPETPATSDTYRAFLGQYLPALRGFCEQQGILKNSFFHLSDEPHGDHLPQYLADRALLRELAPWMPVMDALSDIDFAREGAMDMPVPSIRTALDFHREGIPSWCYYCCGPRDKYLNRLLDTPLPKIAMHGLLFYRWPFQGFLHWGYNYWYESQTRDLIDPFTTLDGRRWERGWAYGDPFLVYPGADGPIDALRWEVFAESLQDYQLLQTLGVARDDPRLAALVSFSEFPKVARWRWELRRALLGGA